MRQYLFILKISMLPLYGLLLRIPVEELRQMQTGPSEPAHILMDLLTSDQTTIQDSTYRTVMHKVEPTPTEPELS